MSKVPYKSLMEIHVRAIGRYWIVGNQEFESLEKIRLMYGYQCVIIIER